MTTWMDRGEGRFLTRHGADARFPAFALRAFAQAPVETWGYVTQGPASGPQTFYGITLADNEGCMVGSPATMITLLEFQELCAEVLALRASVRSLQEQARLTDTTEGWKARALSAEECVEWWEENHDQAWMDQEVCRLRVERDAALKGEA